jgi:methanogenic corrinoid protein MtbC1
MWQQIDAKGRDPLRAATPIATSAAPTPVSHPRTGTVAQLREQWIDACLAYDEQRTEQVLNEAFALYPPEIVTVELLQRAVAQIGEGWYQGDVTVQQEHFCSGLVIRRLDALVMAAQPPSLPGRILLACPPEEQHAIAPLLLTFLLRRRGWEVVYLGANVPTEKLEAAVAAIQPQLVIMAAQLLLTAATLKQAAQLLQQEGVPLAYGGLIFNLLPPLRQRIAGHFLGEQLETAPQMVESLMTVPRPVPTPEAVSDAYLQASDHFQERRSLVEAGVVQSLEAAGQAHNHLGLANRELGLHIAAALALGNMDFVGTDIDWIAGLLRNHLFPVEMLYGYLQAYYQTAIEQLDARGQPIIAWFGELLNGYGSN